MSADEPRDPDNPPASGPKPPGRDYAHGLGRSLFDAGAGRVGRLITVPGGYSWRMADWPRGRRIHLKSFRRMVGPFDTPEEARANCRAYVAGGGE